MKPKPVKRYRRPGYPTRLEVISDPDLLGRHLPPGWRSVPGMAGSVALFLAANSIVSAADTKAKPGPPSAAIVAPIFEHGDGRGATGCIVVAPPVFLSEEEAWQVIDEELAKRGLTLSDKGMSLAGVRIPRRFQTGEFKDGKVESHITEVKGSAKPFAIDRANPQKYIAVEFLSQRDHFSKAGMPSDMSSVQSYDLKQAAENVAKEIRAGVKDKIYAGVLYDPLVTFSWENLAKAGTNSGPAQEKSLTKRHLAGQQSSQAEARRLLRLQVRDFLKWLEAQGAI